MDQKKIKIILILTISILILFTFLAWYLVQTQKEKTKPSSLPPPPPPPSEEKIISFQEEFEKLKDAKILEGPKINICPKILRFAIGPYEAKEGDSQILLIAIKDPQGVEKVSVIVKDEVQEKSINLKLIKGDKKNGLWKGEWKIKKVKEKTYRVTFIIQNQKGEEGRIGIDWKGKKI